MKHKKISIYNFDDEPIYVKTPGYFYLYCCDCGLRHLVVVEKHGQGVRMGLVVDRQATKDVRKLEKIKVVKGDVK